MSDVEAADGLGAGMSSRMGLIWLMVARYACHIPQNVAAEASLDAELPFGVELALVVELAPGVEAAFVVELALVVEMPGTELAQADSDKASAAATIGVASDTSRPVVREVRFMPL